MDDSGRMQRLEQRLRSEGKPGLRAQLKLSPDPRPGDRVYQEVQDICRRAGVLVLLYPRDERLHVLLTRRTSALLHHRAQISFPGGQQEPGEDLQATSLREAREEVGITPQNLCLLGELTPLYIPPSNFCIYPTVASAADPPDFCPCAEEVAEVLEVPLDYLADPKSLERETWMIRGEEVSVPFYRYEDRKIWGATAMVLAELLEILREIDSDED